MVQNLIYKEVRKMESKIGIYNSEHYASPTEMEAINNVAEERNHKAMEKADGHAKKFILTLTHLCGLSDYFLNGIQIESKRTGKAYTFRRKKEDKEQPESSK